MTCIFVNFRHSLWNAYRGVFYSFLRHWSCQDDLIMSLKWPSAVSLSLYVGHDMFRKSKRKNTSSPQLNRKSRKHNKIIHTYEYINTSEYRISTWVLCKYRKLKTYVWYILYNMASCRKEFTFVGYMLVPIILFVWIERVNRVDLFSYTLHMNRGA